MRRVQNRVTNALSDHQTIDAIRREVFHVAVEQTGAFAVQHTVPISDNSANGRACSSFGNVSHSFWTWAEVGMRRRLGFARSDLIGKRELLHGDLVLVRMARPGSIH